MIEVEGKCCVHGAGHYEENLRVPLLLKLPGRSQAREESVLARHIDLVPTVLDVVDLDAPYDGPGGSLLRRLENKDAAGDIVSFSEADGRCALRRALVTDRYKYIYAPRDEIQALYQANPLFFDETCPDPCRDLHVEELYDLHKDPFEKRNLLLAGNLDRERASALERLRLEMALHLNLPPRYSKSVMTGPRRPLDDEELEELEDSLRTLGYIR
jgi:arylsulfatase A-like enzyme